MNTIGERIIFLRENMDLSQVNLADNIGITKMTLYKYEKNICEPKGEIIARLADVLNTSTDFLLGRTENFLADKNTCKEENLFRKKENKLIQKFRRLNSENQAKIEERIDVLLEIQNEKNNE